MIPQTVNSIQAFHGTTLSGEEKKQIVTGELKAVVDTLPKIHDKDNFEIGISQTIDGVVKILKATAWHPNEIAKQKE